MQTDGKSILQLAKDAHRTVVCVIRVRIKNGFSIKSTTYIFDS
jgi:hypothetical protein